MGTLNRLKIALSSYRSYAFLTALRWAVRDSWLNSPTLARRNAHVSLEPRNQTRGSVLLSYIVDPFLDPSKLVATNHTNYWEAVKIAESYLNLGFRVDVVAFGNRTFVPEKPYDVVIDSRHNLERWTPLVGPDCVRVFHIDTSHILFHNAAESQRLLALQQRRAVTLQPHRFERPNLGIEHADCATLLGNEATERTFRYAGKPMYRLPVPSAYRWPWPKDKDWAACRRRYLFLASAGMVHKGLDLVLEAFAARPEFELFVCAPVDPRPLGLHYRTAQPHNVSPDTNRFAYAGAMYEEQDFRRAYARELYETPNIHTVGWVDVASPQFLDLVSSCAGIIHPSCSEGASTAVVTGMHAALIPILTYESGIDTGEFGFTLDPVSVEHLGDAVARLAALSPSLVEKRARAAWECANQTHTREQYAQRYARFAQAITSHSGASLAKRLQEIEEV